MKLLKKYQFSDQMPKPGFLLRCTSAKPARERQFQFKKQCNRVSGPTCVLSRSRPTDPTVNNPALPSGIG